MSDSTRRAGPAEAERLAAVMAAVQAFLDEEARAARSRAAVGPSRLSAWKTTPWPAMRDGEPGRTSSWRQRI